MVIICKMYSCYSIDLIRVVMSGIVENKMLKMLSCVMCILSLICRLYSSSVFEEMFFK